MWQLLLFILAATAEEQTDKDGESSRKILGSSVVTSVSVIMDAGNGSKIYADAVGKPVSKPHTAGDIASPIDLLSPDRYEFYTFDDSGDLVKRLMTLEEIHDIIATGDDDALTLDSLASNGFIPEKRVNDVVNNVQNVLKEEIKMHKNPEKPEFDTPDVSDSWSMILPAVFGNSGGDIKPEPITHVTPDTIMVEPTIKVVATTEQISTTEKVMTLQTKKTTPKSTTTTTEKTPMINVEIITNSNSTTERTVNVITENIPVVEIKPQHDLEATKENLKPYQISKSTKRPYPVRVTTFRPIKKPVATRTTPRTTSQTTSTTPSTTTTSTTPSTTTTSTTSSTTTTSTTPSTTTTSTTSTTTPASTTSSTTTASTTLSTTTASTTPITTTASTTLSSTSQTTSTTSPTLLIEADNIQQSSTLVFQKLEPVTTSTKKPIQNPQDSIQQSSSLVFEKIAPPVETTTEMLTTTEIPTTVVYTTTPSATTTIPSSTTNLPETTTELPTTTEQLKQTLFTTETTTNQPESTSTFGSLSTFFIISDNKLGQDSFKNTEDLNTQSTKYFTNKINNSLDSTTERQSTDRSTLEQLLLTSTNIYEINSELSEVKTTTNSDEIISSTEDNNTEKIFVKLINPTEPPTSTTTDQTFIDTIEQLISQAIGTIPPLVEQEKEATLVQEMMMKSTNKTMPEIMSETATIASKLVGITEEVTVPTTTVNDIDLLSDSVGSLLSQIYSDVTTIENEVISTTSSAETVSTTIVPPTTTQEITTETTTLEDDFVPHIINITIIRNANRTQSKPAKSDISLEKDFQELYNEMKKNSSLSTNTTNEIPKIEELTTTEIITEITTDEITSTEPSTTPLPTTTIPDPKPSIVITINENKTKGDDNKWTLVSTIAPHKAVTQEPTTEAPIQQIASIIDPPVPVDLVPKPLQGFGLEDSTAKLDTDIYQFVQLCNELAFGFWKSVTTGISSARSVIVSPFAATSLLAMVFLGARGATSGEMNEILKLDDMVTFNPHLIFKNVSESIEANPDSGIAISAIIRELYSDRSKGKLLGFYKERVRQFYDGHVEEASFREIGDVIRRRTNLLVKKNTDGKILEFLKDSIIIPKAPLAGISVSIFETDCSQGSIEGRDGELHFIVLPTMRQRRLIPIPATTYRSGFLAGYEPSLDATAAALGTKDQIISTIFIMPGQQGMAAPGDGLARLEKRLVESSFKKGAWSRLLRALIPRPGLELQIPRFQHRSLINATQSLKRMGLHELFDANKADLKGLNGVAHELHLSDVIQINEFATCGERRIGEAHHKEVYPATTERKNRLLLRDWEEPRDYQRAFHDPLHDPSYLDLPLALRPRQARLPDIPRLRFDRPFLYFVRHNPSGLILHMGRFNPRLLP